MIRLANSLFVKYAKNDDMTCTCEQANCKLMGSHEAGKCKNKSTGKGCMYLGPICDSCAQYLDPQYLFDLK